MTKRTVDVIEDVDESEEGGLGQDGRRGSDVHERSIAERGGGGVQCKVCME